MKRHFHVKACVQAHPFAGPLWHTETFILSMIGTQRGKNERPNQASPKLAEHFKSRRADIHRSATFQMVAQLYLFWTRRLEHKSYLQNLHTQIMSHQSRGATMQQCRELEADIQNLELESSALDLLADVSPQICFIRFDTECPNVVFDQLESRHGMGPL